MTVPANILMAILDVFGSVGEWLVGFIPSLEGLFWNAETGLTFMGILGVAGLAFSVVFLCIGVIQRFLHFRG